MKNSITNEEKGDSLTKLGYGTASKGGTFFKTFSALRLSKNLRRFSALENASEGRVTPEEFEFLLGTIQNPKATGQIVEASLLAAARCGWPVETVPAARERILSEPNVLEKILKYAVDGKLILHKEIPMTEIQKGEFFASGASAKVYKAVWDKKDAILKVFDVDSISFTIEEFRKETAICCLFEHPNLVRTFGASVVAHDNSYYILNEFCLKGGLDTLMSKEYSNLDLQKKIGFLSQISSACAHLHRFDLIHRDLKSGNVLVTRDYVCKVTDFGTSRALGKEMTTGIGSPQWMAPEVLEHSHYTLSADVYS